MSEIQKLSEALDKAEYIARSINQSSQSNRGIWLNHGAVVGVIGIFVGIMGIAFAAVCFSQLGDLQREMDSLKNRTDINEAYINNINQRIK